MFHWICFLSIWNFVVSRTKQFNPLFSNFVNRHVFECSPRIFAGNILSIYNVYNELGSWKRQTYLMSVYVRYSCIWILYNFVVALGKQIGKKIWNRTVTNGKNCTWLKQLRKFFLLLKLLTIETYWWCSYRLLIVLHHFNCCTRLTHVFLCDSFFIINKLCFPKHVATSFRLYTYFNDQMMIFRRKNKVVWRSVLGEWNMC